jgi:AAA domain
MGVPPGEDSIGLRPRPGAEQLGPLFGQNGHDLSPDPQPPEPEEPDPPEQTPGSQEDSRQLVLTPASDIKPKRVLWLWRDRLALGTLALLAGREGVGKSTVAYWLAAQITRGLLPGEFEGKPRSVLVAATEDSWEYTIVPRLIAADADLTKVHRIEVIDHGLHDYLELPADLTRVGAAAREKHAALLLLDPLISRISEKLDSHRDAEVRRALEPLVAMANQVTITVLGLIHHNKSGSTDPLQLVMASKAFPAVARSVHTVVPDPDDERHRLFGTPKNNLGRSDLPTLGFGIDSYPVETSGGDPAWTGRLVWSGESNVTITDAMRRSAETSDDKSAAAEATDWLEDYLTSKGGTAESADAKKAGHAAGHSDKALRMARERLKLDVESHGFPRQTWWSLPGTQPVKSEEPSRAQ